MQLKQHFSLAYLLKSPRLRVICEFEMYTTIGQRKMLHGYRSDFWPGTPLIRTRNCGIKGKQCHKNKHWLYLFHCMRALKGCGHLVSAAILFAFYRGRAKQSPSFIRAVQPTSTALTKQTECFRCKEGFSAVFIFFGLTLHLLVLAKLTSMLKLKENFLNVF